MIKEISIKEFTESGLLLIINQVLHIFGMAIVVELDDNKEFTRMYPARVKFRGFGDNSIDKAYRKVSDYMVKNALELKEEAYEE